MSGLTQTQYNRLCFIWTQHDSWEAQDSYLSCNNCPVVFVLPFLNLTEAKPTSFFSISIWRTDLLPIQWYLERGPRTRLCHVDTRNGCVWKRQDLVNGSYEYFYHVERARVAGTKKNVADLRIRRKYFWIHLWLPCLIAERWSKK